MKDNMIAFFGGAVLTVLANLHAIIKMLADFSVKAFTAAALGVVGGIAGMVGKEILWPWLKRKFKIKRK